MGGVALDSHENTFSFPFGAFRPIFKECNRLLGNL